MNIGLVIIGAGWFAAAVSAVAVAGCGGVAAARPRSFDRPEVVVHNPTRLPLGATSLGVMRDAVAARYRPGPDRRFLLAVAEVSLVLAPRETPGQVTARFEGSRWHIASAGEEIGTLSEVPTYGEAVALLVRWTRRELDRNPIVFQGNGPDTVQLGRQITKFRSREVAKALRSIDERWEHGERSAGLLLCGVRGLGYLAAQSLDRAEMADRLGARALATLLIARSATGQGLIREEVLLAQSMGYGADAVTVAASLPRQDPVRLVVEGALDTATTIPPGADPLSTYLYATRFGAQWDRSGWREWVRTSSFPAGVDLATLKPGVDPGQFDTKRDVPSLIQLTALARTWEITGAWLSALAHRCLVDARLAHLAGTHRLAGRWVNCAWPRRGLLERFELTVLLAAAAIAKLPNDERQGEWFITFERALGRLGDHLTGPFLDPIVYGDYLRGHAYSALDLRARFLLNSASSRPRARRLVEGLSAVSREPTAALGRALGTLAAADGRREWAERMLAGLESTSSLYPAAIEEMLESAGEVLRRDTLMLVGVSRLASSSDTRPRNMSRLASVAYLYLFDVFLAERLSRHHAGQGGAGTPFAAAWHAWLGGDWPALWRLTEGRQRLPVRLRALELLARSKQASDDRLDDEYHRLIAEHPAAWEARGAYVKWSRSRPERRSRAIKVVETWVAEPSPARGVFDEIFASSALARLYQEQGRLQDAWHVIRPEIKSYQFGAMQRGALILQELGRNDDAEQLASRAVRRYPALPAARAVLAEIRWRRGDMTGAASALQDPQLPRLSRDAWRRHIGPAFLRAFTTVPAADLAKTSRRLSTSGIGHDELMALGAAAADSGRNDVAFTLVSMMDGSDSSAQVALGYNYLHAWRGAEAAAAWARPKLSPEDAVRASLTFYRYRVYDGLWDLTDGDYPDSDTRRYFWLLRAAAAVQDPHLSPRRRLELQQHFALAEIEPYHTLGRFLLGLEDDTLLFRFADTPHRQCEVAYFLGIKARSQGRLREASEWFRVAIETNQTGDGEYHLAWDELARWFDPQQLPTAVTGP